MQLLWRRVEIQAAEQFALRQTNPKLSEDAICKRSCSDFACAAMPYPSVVARETTSGAAREPRKAADHEIVPYSAASRNRNGVGGIRKNRP